MAGDPDEIEQTVSEYAGQRIDIRAGNALISAEAGLLIAYPPFKLAAVTDMRLTLSFGLSSVARK